MKKPIKRLLIISQVLGWSALTASSCTNNDQQTINGSVSNKADADQDTSPTDGNNKGDIIQQPESSDAIKNGSDKEEVDKNQQTETVSDSGNPAGHNMNKTSESGTEGSMVATKDSSSKITNGSQGDGSIHSETDPNSPSHSNDGTAAMKSTVPEKQIQDKEGGGATTSMPVATSDGESHGKQVEGSQNQETSAGKTPQGDSTKVPGAKGGTGGDEHHEEESQIPPKPVMHK